MKTLFQLFFLSLLLSSVFSCKKDHNDDGLSDNIKNFVPQYIIDSMRNWGLKINEGQTPPVINGIYVFSPNLCTFDNSGYNRINNYFDNYKYWFYNQDNKALTVKLSSKNISGTDTDTANGAGAFLSGKDDLFTAFIEVNGVDEGVSYSRIDFYSGQLTGSGVNNFQTAFYMKSKGDDPSNKLVAVGSSRIFKDGDETTTTTDTYRLAPSTNSGKTISGSK